MLFKLTLHRFHVRKSQWGKLTLVYFLIELNFLIYLKKD